MLRIVWLPTIYENEIFDEETWMRLKKTRISDELKVLQSAIQKKTSDFDAMMNAMTEALQL